MSRNLQNYSFFNLEKKWHFNSTFPIIYLLHITMRSIFQYSENFCGDIFWSFVILLTQSRKFERVCRINKIHHNRKLELSGCSILVVNISCVYKCWLDFIDSLFENWTCNINKNFDYYSYANDNCESNA